MGQRYAPYHKKLKEVFGQSTLPSLLVDGWEVVTCLLHYLNNTIERYTVVSVGIHRVEVCIEGAGKPLQIGRAHV